MTSAKQVEANRQNAQHSSGPTSAAGRQKAALNSVSHGLTAHTLILAAHEEEPYRLYAEGIALDLAPVGTYEAVLVTSIVDARWRIHQIASMEAAIYTVGFRTHSKEFEDHSPEEAVAICRMITFEEKRKELDRLHRYESRLMRQVAKDTQLLLQCQAARKEQEAKDKEAIPYYGETESVDEFPENGSVLSNAKFKVQPITANAPDHPGPCR